MTHVVDGQPLAQAVLDSLKSKIDRLNGMGVSPSLAVVTVGDSDSIHACLSVKERACTEAGIRLISHRLPETASMESLTMLLEQLNADPHVHGVVIHLPVPARLDQFMLVSRIAPEKDVDTLHPLNLGRLARGMVEQAPSRARACMQLLDHLQVNLHGKNVVVLGENKHLGNPFVPLCLNRHATITVCPKDGENISDIASLADVLLIAEGAPNTLPRHWVRPGAVVIDLRLFGDGKENASDLLDFDSLRSLTSAICPAKSCTEPLSVALLLENTVRVALRQQDKEQGRQRVILNIQADDQPGVLSHVLNYIRQDGVNITELNASAVGVSANLYLVLDVEADGYRVQDLVDRVFQIPGIKNVDHYKEVR